MKRKRGKSKWRNHPEENAQGSAIIRGIGEWNHSRDRKKRGKRKESYHVFGAPRKGVERNGRGQQCVVKKKVRIRGGGGDLRTSQGVRTSKEGERGVPNSRATHHVSGQEGNREKGEG